MIIGFLAPMVSAVTTFSMGRIVASRSEEPEDGGAILAKTLEAHGGLERFHAVRDWRIVAERNLSGGDVTHEIYEEYLLRDDDFVKTLLVKKREGSTLVYGHDGREGYALVNGRLRDDAGAAGEGYYRAHGEYYLRGIPFKWADPGMHVTYAGREDTDDGELLLLRIAAEENVGRAWKDVWVAAIDAETHLLREARLTHHREMETWMGEPDDSKGSNGGTTLITYRYSDYRDVKGLRIPFCMEYLSSGRKTGENDIQTIEIDAGLPSRLFDKKTWQK